MNCQPCDYLPPPSAFPFLQTPETQTQAVMKRKTPVLFDLPYQLHARSRVARPDEHVMKREEVGDGDLSINPLVPLMHALMHIPARILHATCATCAMADDSGATPPLPGCALPSRSCPSAPFEGVLGGIEESRRRGGMNRCGSGEWKYSGVMLCAVSQGISPAQ
ncbi:hypothetical protein Q8A67_022353 [Cirrhinus molitorella]|uniref:Uncharacterized protein n=1 Tax=Cirrhinus molitorella TaxID=172907 RepID=A0AA88P7M1_9TELE|nr:hypothetical protein Q8A67_022353 [Cirrhinus molitorella]